MSKIRSPRSCYALKMKNFKAYALLIAAVSLNAWLVTMLRDQPALAAFAATLGGTLAGALGFQVLAKISAWAKRVSFSDGLGPDTHGPYANELKTIWATSQRVQCDLTKDGRNIRKDAWIQLHGRFTTALSLPDVLAYAHIADGLVDHLLTFAEVPLDPVLVREFSRMLGPRFGNEMGMWGISQAIERSCRGTRLRPFEVKRLLEQIMFFLTET